MKKKIKNYVKLLTSLRSKKRTFIFLSKKQNIINKYYYHLKNYQNNQYFNQNSTKVIYNKNKAILKKPLKNKQRKILSRRTILQYQIPYRKKKRFISSIILKYKLKKTLQDFLKKYLNIYFQIKINNFTHEFKNLQFYRLFFKPMHWKTFPEIEIKKIHKLDLFTTRNKQDSLLKKDWSKKQGKQNYIYLTSLNNQLFNVKKTTSKIKNLNTMLKLGKETLNYKKKNLKKKISKTNKNLEILISKKLHLIYKKKHTHNNKNTYINFNIKKEKENNQKNLTFRNNQKKRIIKRSLPLMSLLTKYFDIQLIVNHIARELESTRNQWIVLDCMKKVLAFVAFPRLKAYQISIFGRINYKSKARKIVLKEGKVPIQIFRKRVNFSMAQARAKIGTFGVKMWIYF